MKDINPNIKKGIIKKHFIIKNIKITLKIQNLRII